MKPNRLNYTLLALLLTAYTSQVLAHSYIVGISPSYPIADRSAILKAVLGFVLEGASNGDQIQFYDALNQQPLARCIIPKASIFQDNARARALRLKLEIVTIQKQILNSTSSSPELDGIINVPEFLALAGSQLRAPGEPATIILIGSPFYMNPQNPTFNMQEAYPSDANLLVDQRISVFGTANKQKRLAGIAVHYAYLHNCFTNDYHQERLGRFWCLFIGRQEGVLSTFAPDVNLAFQRARDQIRQNFMSAEIDSQDTKVEMRQIMARSIPKWFGPTNVAAPPTTTTIALPFNPLPDKLGIGIMWAQKVDCDLYVKPSSRARELCFGNTTTPEGRYFHDYRTSNQGIDYEYVELKAPIGNLSDITAWVNLYAGSAPKIQGTVVVCYNGRTHQGSFSLLATSGNKAVDIATRASSPYWIQLDLLKILASGSVATSR